MKTNRLDGALTSTTPPVDSSVDISAAPPGEVATHTPSESVHEPAQPKFLDRPAFTPYTPAEPAPKPKRTRAQATEAPTFQPAEPVSSQRATPVHQPAGEVSVLGRLQQAASHHPLSMLGAGIGSLGKFIGGAIADSSVGGTLRKAAEASPVYQALSRARTALFGEPEGTEAPQDVSADVDSHAPTSTLSNALESYRDPTKQNGGLISGIAAHAGERVRAKYQGHLPASASSPSSQQGVTLSNTPAAQPGGIPGLPGSIDGQQGVTLSNTPAGNTVASQLTPGSGRVDAHQGVTLSNTPGTQVDLSSATNSVDGGPAPAANGLKGAGTSAGAGAASRRPSGIGRGSLDISDAIDTAAQPTAGTLTPGAAAQGTEAATSGTAAGMSTDKSSKPLRLEGTATMMMGELPVGTLDLSLVARG